MVRVDYLSSEDIDVIFQFSFGIQVGKGEFAIIVHAIGEDRTTGEPAILYRSRVSEPTQPVHTVDLEAHKDAAEKHNAKQPKVPKKKFIIDQNQDEVGL